MIGPSRLHQHFLRTAAAVGAFACAPMAGRWPAAPLSTRHRGLVRAAETRLLFDNATTGIVASLVVAALLTYAEGIPPTPAAARWLAVMTLVSAGRY